MTIHLGHEMYLEYKLKFHEDIASLKIYSENSIIRFLQKLGIIRTKTINELAEELIKIIDVLT